MYCVSSRASLPRLTGVLGLIGGMLLAACGSESQSPALTLTPGPTPVNEAALQAEFATLNELAASPTLNDQLALLRAVPCAPDAQVAPDESLTQELAAFHQAHPEFAAMVLLDGEGCLRAVDPFPAQTPVPPERGFHSASWYRIALAEAEPRVWVGTDEDITGLSGAILVVPMYQPGSLKALGLLMAVKPLESTPAAP